MDGEKALKIPKSSIILAIVAFYLYVAYSAPFLGQWDSFDYLKQIVSHQVSALGIGRPVFLGYNILLWESAKTLFHLESQQVETVTMAGAVLLGTLGIILFQRLCRQILGSPASRMAALGLAVSPLYALYAGFIMTEVPMLAALTASALVLWKSGGQKASLNDIIGGVFFGLAIGIREQALTLAAALIWIIFCRRDNTRSRIRSTALFTVSAASVALAPAMVFYFRDQAGFIERTRTWLHAIPTGPIQFRNNFQASLLFTLAVCPGAWFAAAGAGIYRLFHRPNPLRAAGERSRHPGSIPHAAWGVVACLLLPIAVLWRDADVQMHPRYALVALPASLLLCASLYQRWVPSRKGPAIWAAAQILVFGVALAVLSPYRQAQTRKIEFARVMRDSIPGKGLLIAGNYSPVLDYYRGIGLRPGWQILWSGWNWGAGNAETAIRGAWAEGVPVYLSKDPLGWSYFEGEFLDVHFLLKNCRQEQVAPMLYRIYPSAEIPWENVPDIQY